MVVPMKSMRFYCFPVVAVLAVVFLVGCSSPKGELKRNARKKRDKRPEVTLLPPQNMHAAGTRLVPLGAFVIPNRELREKYGPLPQGTISVPGEKRGGQGNKR